MIFADPEQDRSDHISSALHSADTSFCINFSSQSNVSPRHHKIDHVILKLV